MDNSWQIKCTSAWVSPSPPLPLPPLPTSSQLPTPSGSRNQMDMNVGHYFHPCIAQQSGATERMTVQEPLVFSTLNLGSCSKSGKPDLGNSFLALLSGSSQQLQCDFQQLSNSKPSVAASKLPVHDSGIVARGVGCGVSAARFASFPQLNGNESMGNGTELCPVVASRAMPTSACSRVAVLHNNLQTTHFHLRGAESAKPVLNHAVCGSNDIGREASSLRWGLVAGTSYLNASQHQTTNIQASPRMPLESISSMSTHPPAFTRGRPRVFCLGTSGNLHLSDKGFIGVVCSCHCLPMSVAKFCEHAGSCAVSPGDAVHLESGETIVQWRRACFMKYGMRLPDDSSGWDWPDGIPASGGLMKCNATTISKVPKNYDVSQPVDSFGALIRSGQPWNDFASPNCPYTGRSVLEKSVNMVTHDGQQKNALDGHIVFNGFVSTSNAILPALSNKQTLQTVKESPMSNGLTVSKSALDKGQQSSEHQSVVDYTDFIGKVGNPFIATPSSGNLKSFGTVPDIIRCNSSREAFIMDRDAVSSSIELRLGQPSQQSQTLGGSIPSAMHPQLFGGLCDPQKSQIFEPFVHRAIVPGVTDGSRQNPRHAPAGASDSNRVEKESQSNLMSHALRSLNAMGSAKLDQLKGDATKSSLVSMFHSHFGTLLEGDKQSQAPNNTISRSEHFVPQKETNGMESKLLINGRGVPGHMDRGKVLRTVADKCSYIAAKPNSLFPSKKMPDPFAGTLNGHFLDSSSVHDRQSSACLHQKSVILPDAASNARNSSSQFGKALCVGSSNHPEPVVLRSVNSAASVTAGSGLFSPAAPVGFDSSNSINLANLTSALSNKKGNDLNRHLLDENLRLLALRHVAELSKQDLSISSLEMSPEQGLLYYPLSVAIQRKGSQEGITAPEELREGPYSTNKQQASEDPVRSHQPCFNRYLSSDFEKFPGMEGLNSCCNISTSMQGISVCSKELHVQCPPCHGHGADDQPLLRLGRTESKISSDPSEHERCCQKESNLHFAVNCACAVHSKCLTGCCISRGEAPNDASKEHTEYVGGRAPGQVTSTFDKDRMTPENNRGIVAHCEILKMHSAQWRDVPSKVIGNCNVTTVERPADILDAKATVEDQLADTAAKRSSGTSQDTGPLKEQQMSNGSSGCSAPVVTEVSVEVNNLDSCILDSGDDRYVHDPVIDEGSGIEKCGSSDDALGDGSWVKTTNGTGRIVSKKAVGSNLPKRSSCDLIDELKLRNSFKLKKVGNHIQDGCTLQEHMDHTQEFEQGPKAEKKRKVMKWKRLDATFPVSGLSSTHCSSPKWNSEHSELHLHSSKETPLRAEHGKKKTCCIYACAPSSVKRKRSALSSAKTLPHKRNLHLFEDHHQEWEDCYQTKLKGDIRSPKIPKIAAEKKVKQGWTADFKKHFAKVNHVDTGKTPKNVSIGHAKNIFSHGVETRDKKARPVVCGNSGIISNGKLATKPAKIVSLRSVLKVAKRCIVIENEIEPKTSTETQKGCFSETEGCYEEKERENECQNTIGENEVEPSMFDMKKTSSKNGGSNGVLLMLKKERSNGVHKALKFGTSHGCHSTRVKLKSKETRKRSLHELTGKGSCLKKSCQSGLLDALHEKHPSSAKFLRKNSKCSLQTDFISYEKSCLKNTEDNHGHIGEPRFSSKGNTSQAFSLDSDAFCCVCGNSNKDEINSLLECSRCLIRVHQACYGVPKVPKGRWCCRPCRTSSKNIVCVLCGYGGGAMTRALRSRSIVKSLLEAWKVGEGTKSVISIASFETVQVELGLLNPTSKDETSLLAERDSVPVMRPMNIEPLPRAVLKMDFQKDSDILTDSNSSVGNFQVHNTVTAGVLDPTVTQWVHMVCGLWTPGTRCPNVDTMSAFDVSGASRPEKNKVCSMCNRPGGLCVQCRVVNCSFHFHPWCAHQKGLLQSEIEGDDDEKVGFYGRCMVHATNLDCHTENHLLVVKLESRGEPEFTCARTEGYKGRKKGEGLRNDFHVQSGDSNGCLVTQEQINAWLHINGQKACIKGLVKPPASDIEYDCRKEYARYKQAKGWKNLVVYKSGIHALGLYTSQFISRGAMVVEYVGEIVGLRVADKRETEYQSGRKLQYKSACYFFRIDKEHIIDATCKGGIARFVNHSCLPNCVAKVISVRNEKKVVFFAERDINPGEEITYDYHFNHEDEGKKIPCFCNSKNCRRYLN
ncbi:uncharacterized protein LOC131254706 [Magnolia sinica]|uniref:uncharacterized protein LOC131254706 n=1 Tax=Magnolia sinica TaxID=86752 RepID=UPI002657B5A4|nr:uncharacterized protein LOC131254706 [Magnolia sinica]